MAYMEKNLEWFKSYLRNRKQYIQIDDKNKTDILRVEFQKVQIWTISVATLT